MKAIEKAIERKGLLLICLLRLCPLIPFNMLNYLMGLTSINSVHYILGSLAMIPGVAVYIFIGTTVSSITSAAGGGAKDGDDKNKTDTSTITLVIVIVGSVLACGGIVWVSIIAKRILNEELKKSEEEKQTALVE